MIRHEITCDECGTEGEYFRNAAHVPTRMGEPLTGADRACKRWSATGARHWLEMMHGWHHDRTANKDYCSECLDR